MFGLGPSPIDAIALMVLVAFGLPRLVDSLVRRRCVIESHARLVTPARILQIVLVGIALAHVVGVLIRGWLSPGMF